MYRIKMLEGVSWSMKWSSDYFVALFFPSGSLVSIETFLKQFVKQKSAIFYVSIPFLIRCKTNINKNNSLRGQLL